MQLSSESEPMPSMGALEILEIKKKKKKKKKKGNMHPWENLALYSAGYF